MARRRTAAGFSDTTRPDLRSAPEVLQPSRDTLAGTLSDAHLKINPFPNDQLSGIPTASIQLGANPNSALRGGQFGVAEVCLRLDVLPPASDAHRSVSLGWRGDA